MVQCRDCRFWLPPSNEYMGTCLLFSSGNQRNQWAWNIAVPKFPSVLVYPVEVFSTVHSFGCIQGEAGDHPDSEFFKDGLE